MKLLRIDDVNSFHYLIFQKSSVLSKSIRKRSDSREGNQKYTRNGNQVYFRKVSENALIPVRAARNTLEMEIHKK